MWYVTRRKTMESGNQENRNRKTIEGSNELPHVTGLQALIWILPDRAFSISLGAS